MAPGVLQDCNWAARGWEAMSFFVRFLYSSKEALKICSKLVEEAADKAAEGGLCDMWLVEGRR